MTSSDIGSMFYGSLFLLTASYFWYKALSVSFFIHRIHRETDAVYKEVDTYLGNEKDLVSKRDYLTEYKRDGDDRDRAILQYLDRSKSAEQYFLYKTMVSALGGIEEKLNKLKSIFGWHLPKIADKALDWCNDFIKIIAWIFLVGATLLTLVLIYLIFTAQCSNYDVIWGIGYCGFGALALILTDERVKSCHNRLFGYGSFKISSEMMNANHKLKELMKDPTIQEIISKAKS